MFFSSHGTLTELCRIMAKHGSDKGAFQGIGMHNYTKFYHTLFSELRGKVSSLFELGIGSKRSDIMHTMGARGTPGASLRGWREYFPNANIYAADIDRDILQPEYRIFKFFCDQTNPASIDALWQMPEVVGKKFDIILEDGLHEFNAQYLFMEKSLEKLTENGFYICEDIPDNDFPRWIPKLRYLSQKYIHKSFQIVKIDNPKNNWNSVIVVK